MGLPIIHIKIKIKDSSMTSQKMEGQKKFNHFKLLKK
jgi:hypothetical protein